MCPRCKELEEQIHELEIRVLGVQWEPPLELRLTGHEAVILQALIAHDRTVPNWLLYEATRTAPNARGDDVDAKIVPVRISLLRSKLRRFGLGIITVWAQGYRLEPETRVRLLNWNKQEAAA